MSEEETIIDLLIVGYLIYFIYLIYKFSFNQNKRKNNLKA